MRTKYTHNIFNNSEFKQSLQKWSQQFDDVVWLDSNNHNSKYSKYDCILAVDAFTSIQTDYTNAFDKLKDYQSTTNDWIFGYLTYDLKNAVENLESNNFDRLEFPDLYFFQPKKLFFIKGDKVTVKYINFVADELEDDLKTICYYEESKDLSTHNVTSSDFDIDQNSIEKQIKIKLRIHKDEYFNKVNKLLEHINRGDIYEANFCQEFFAENTRINPIEIYNKLNNISNPPFATFLKCDDKYLLSASPERYLKKKGNTIVSQPIKGTAKRSDDKDQDRALKYKLSIDEKERSENIMIVDLVRNDLSKTAKKGSVEVKELCKIYTFDQVHQMISTVQSKVEKGTHPIDVIATTFPMGSMTGAPKISAMQIIEALEETKRGLYSGAVGYISPKGNFDFNVVIRSILYNETNNYVSYSVGGAITAKSDPLKEYEECLIKAKAMREALT